MGRPGEGRGEHSARGTGRATCPRSPRPATTASTAPWYGPLEVLYRDLAGDRAPGRTRPAGTPV
jgi:hypothetical protein